MDNSGASAAAPAGLSDDQFGVIVLTFLEGQASDEQIKTLNRELAGNAERRKLFVLLSRQNGLLSEVFADHEAKVGQGVGGSSSKVIPVLRRMPVKRSATVRRSRPLAGALLWAAGIAAMVTIGLYYGLSGSGGARKSLRIVEAQSAFILEKGSKRNAATNEMFAPGDGIATNGPDSSAEIAFPDGTHMWLGPNTEISQIAESSGKRVALASGNISADVVKQPQPLIVSTPTVDAKIVGTKFNLSAASSQSRLDVIEGLVKLTRRKDNASIDVGAGEYTVADEQRPLALSRWTPVDQKQPKIDFVQCSQCVPQAPQDSVDIDFPYELNAGDLVIAVVGWNDIGSSVKSIGDNLSNKYTLAIGPTRGKICSQSIYYAKNVVGGPARVHVVFDQYAVFADIRILEYRGFDKSNPLDGAHGQSGENQVADSGKVSTTAPGLIFGAGTTKTQFTEAGMGFTQRILTTPDGDDAEDMIVTSKGSYSAGAPLNNPGDWVFQVAAFKAASVQQQDWRTIGK
jgi:hypothetical protein